MLSNALGDVLSNAFKHAKDLRHEFMTLEHLLLSLIDDNAVSRLIVDVGGDLLKIQHELDEFIAEYNPVLPEDDHRETQPTVGFQRVLQRAVFHVQSSGREEVGTLNVLVALFAEQESHARYILESQGITRLDVVQYISHGHVDIDDFDLNDDGEVESIEHQEPQQSPLEEFAVNLNERALDNKIDPLVGRDEEVERVVQVLCRRRKNNPLLVGEPGVGKTAIAEGLAKRIVEKDVPEVLQDAVIYAIEIGSLVAGTKYRGDFEKRLKSILKDLKKKPHAVVFIDEIHTMIGAGSTSGGAMDASNLLKPALSSGELKCIGATTYTEYRNVFEKDRALARRFQKVDVTEPSIDDAIEILKGVANRFESHHEVTYTQDAIKAAVELSAKHIHDRFLPDKAIDVIDEAGAHRRIKNSENREINLQDIEKMVAKIARIPSKHVSTDDKDTLKRLEDNLKMVVFGQDQAIGELATAIKLARSGLREGKKPIGSFLFAGPTGVGKTEVTRQLALSLGVELQRFDMSEYMERHTVSRLIGAPPGYVGYEQGGLLTEAINKHPHCVLLLDEVEKAHPDLFNILLQVMDHGTLTDNNGRKSDFRNVILVMTTNAGAEQMSRANMGFTQQDHSSDGMGAINKMFTPEFRNRLDKIVQFSPLDKRSISHVVDKFIIQLEAKLDAQNVSLDITQEARDWLSDNGYDVNMGARPMARVIQEHIKKPLADALLFGDLVDGGQVKVLLKEGELVIKTHAKKPSKKAKEAVE